MKFFIQVCFTIMLLMFLGISAKAGMLGCIDNTDCDDGLFCTPTSICEMGECVILPFTGCPAVEDGCIEFGSCDEVNDTCPGVPNNGLCEEGELCDANSRECVEDPVGACCFFQDDDSTPTCEIINEFNCIDEFGGEFQGPDSVCEELTCAEPEPPTATPTPTPEPEEPSEPIVIIPTMGQWGMIIATIFLGFFAIVALRKRTES